MFAKNILKLVLALASLPATTLALGDVNLLIEKIITTSINSSADPCQDFYAYACGNYAEQHRGSSYKEMTGYMDQQFNIKILNLMDSIYQHDYQVSGPCQSFVEKARVYLKACRAEGKRTVKKYFEEIKPGPMLEWPLFQQSFSWLFERTFDVWLLLGKLQSYGLNNVLISQEVEVNSEGKFHITLQPVVTEDNSTLPVSAILQILLMNLGVKNPEGIVRQLEATNEQILRILQATDRTSQLSYDVTYGDLIKWYPKINFKAFFCELLGKYLTPETAITLKNPSYFQYLNDKLESSFEKEHLCNYLMLKQLLYLAFDSSSQFKSLDCIKDLRNKFDLAVNFLYYHHIYAFEAKNVNVDIDQMFRSILRSLQKTFEFNNLHLTDYEKQLLLNKLSCVRLNVGNLPQNVSFDQIEEFYAKVPPLDKNNYYKNHLLMLKHRFLKSLHYPQQQTYFIVPDNKLGSSSGPYYVAKQNMIILPFGSLAQPLYDYRYHDLYKYSLLGFILAHELVHAFDTSGLYFNGQGLEDPVCLPSILKNKNFQLSLECLQSQLPTDVIEERIADIVGIQTVYKVFVSKMNCLQPSSLQETWNKFFYLNTAQFFCGKKNINFIDHDTDAERLNQIVMNSLGFNQAFKCPTNSKMNPAIKCRLY